ncbi:META domain-containing protein [Maribellus mangrovi]|uniref:META domain-containing protein n=1 Tax=Maribellus mangrovi TaxID=3133146 RepID=UPI0030EC4139
MKKSILTVLLIALFLASCRDNDAKNCEELTGKWEIKEFISIESVLYAKDNAYNPLIEFNDDGTYNLYLDRNGCQGSFEFGEGDAIHISPAGCTEMCCDSDFSIKAAIMLNQVETYEMQDNDLELHIPTWGFLVLKKVSD